MIGNIKLIKTYTKVTAKQPLVSWGEIHFSVDTFMLFLYDFSSDRVAETCEDCDPERLLREPFRLYGGESLETQDKPFKTCKVADFICVL